MSGRFCRACSLFLRLAANGRHLPKDFPPRSTVWEYFDLWRYDQDRAGAPGLLASTAISYPWPSHIFAEGGYGGGKLRGALDKWTIEIIERSDTAKGVELLPRRRVVERTFARPGRCRREAKDVEATIKSAVARITIASIRLMISPVGKNLISAQPS